MAPLISCIMSNYNTDPKMFMDAIDSILTQSLSDFELILIDDKSSNTESRAVIEQYAKKDDRIIPVYNDSNRGLAGALNIGLKIASGKYIARFDTDDICVKNRFEKQYQYMEKYNIDVCSSFAHLFGTVDKVIASSFNSNKAVAIQLLFSCYLYHTPVMIKRIFMQSNNILYDETLDNAEDFDLFVRCRDAGGKLCIMPKVLFHYRIHPNSVCHIKRKNQVSLTEQICKKQLDRFNIDYSDAEFETHLILCGLHELSWDKHEPLFNWCEKLVNANQNMHYFDMQEFKKVLYNRLFNSLIKSDITINKKFQLLFSKKHLITLTNIYSVIYKLIFSFRYKLNRRKV